MAPHLVQYLVIAIELSNWLAKTGLVHPARRMNPEDEPS
jgi:hypothetical protein